MQPTSSFPATKPMMSYQPALRLAKAGKSKQRLGRPLKFADQLFVPKLGHILLKAVRIVGQTQEVTKSHVNIEVPMRTAVGTARPMLGLALQECGASVFSETTLAP